MGQPCTSLRAVSKLTFAIPYYSEPAYLRRALESLASQSGRDFKILVVDDGGLNAKGEDVVKEFKALGIRYERNEKNLGTAGNWNRCLELVDTELVTLFHADDELLPDYASVMLEAATKFPDAAAYFCEADIIGTDGRSVFSMADAVKQWLRPRGNPIFLNGEPGVTSLLRGNFIMCPTLCYRKAKLGDSPFRPDRRMVMDLDLTLSLLFRGETLVGLGTKAYRYRRHAASQTELLTQSLVRFEEEISLYESVSRLSAEYGWNHAAKAGSSKTMVRLNLCYRGLQDVLRGDLSAAAEKFGLARRSGSAH